jgi:TPR repeat protein
MTPRLSAFRRWLTVMVLGVLVLLPLGSLAAPTPEEAKKIQNLKLLAEQGNANAQYALGYGLLMGQGLAKDQVEAVKWFRKAADQDNVPAQVYLGLCYSNGAGVAKDEVAAVKWFRKAADQGNADAQAALGVCYNKGEGVNQDDAEAIKWHQKAADQGNAKAQYNLGLQYFLGHGVPKNLVEAYAYINLAGISNEEYRKQLGVLEKYLTPEDRLKGQQRAKVLQKEIEAKIAAAKVGK